MLKLLPINDNDIYERLSRINLHLTKSKKEEGKRKLFVKYDSPTAAVAPAVCLQSHLPIHLPYSLHQFVAVFKCQVVLCGLTFTTMNFQ
jgi:hypothetical protein